ncbi:prepilin peptidase [Algiphilus sp.]|uniref:prepilin peptidase n=1 Tax=Algiphilus sp. TaxID=1872431 RepID=UPI0025BB1A05|nr:prepilin peptidase [Algiphilus sp.]MCK5768926.1 prepilin peptidase [Algiphilus sp.]
MTLVAFFAVGMVLGGLVAGRVNRALDRRDMARRVGWLRAMRVPAFCNACRRPLPLRDRVPVVSWLLLDGRARCCGAAMPLRSLVVEVIGVFGGGTLLLALLSLL